jgi:hypothetical protein
VAAYQAAMVVAHVVAAVSIHGRGSIARHQQGTCTVLLMQSVRLSASLLAATRRCSDTPLPSPPTHPTHLTHHPMTSWRAR